MKQYIHLVMLCGVMFFATTASAITDNENPEPRKTSDANVYGHILDAKSSQHIPYVVISLKGTTYATGADATGHYYMKNLPEGTYTLVAEAIGYKTVEKSVKLVNNKNVEVNFTMQEEALSMNDVVVSATRNETNKKNTATIVNVASAKLFENTASSNLAESMAFQPGLRVENTCGNCGAVQLRINGLEGQYSQVLLD